MKSPAIEKGLKRPDPSEYVAYYGRYIDLVADGPIVEVLRSQLRDTLDLLRSIPEAKASHRYAPEKWSIKEVVGHVADGERVFAYRALRFARADTTELPGFEENEYVKHADFGARSLSHLVDELEAIRGATIRLFEGLGDDAGSRKGIASGNPVTVQALAYIIAGHERHHVKILRERYLA